MGRLILKQAFYKNKSLLALPPFVAGQSQEGSIIPPRFFSYFHPPCFFSSSQDRRQRLLSGAIFEFVSDFLRGGWNDALAGEHHLGHFAERQL